MGWDEGLDIDGPFVPYYQTARMHLYQEYVESIHLTERERVLARLALRINCLLTGLPACPISLHLSSSMRYVASLKAMILSGRIVNS